MSWPKGFLGAVSLTFDDGLPSQLSRAAPLLDEHGLMATFYVAGLNREDYRERLRPWKALAEAGHEVGNHTLSHRCSSNFQGDPDAAGLENMTLEDIRQDIEEAHRRITEVIPGGSRTFAYPCYQTSVGRGAGKRSYVPVVAELFTAARSRGEYGYANTLRACDLHELWSWPVERLSQHEMVGLAVKVASEGGWAIFTFHGVDEGHLSVSEHELKGLLNFLSGERAKIWVAPVVEVAEYVTEERRKGE